MRTASPVTVPAAKLPLDQCGSTGCLGHKETFVSLSNGQHPTTSLALPDMSYGLANTKAGWAKRRHGRLKFRLCLSTPVRSFV